MRQKDIKRSDESTYIAKHQSIDAGVIKFKGRCFERQYNVYDKKTVKRGLKVCNNQATFSYPNKQCYDVFVYY